MAKIFEITDDGPRLARDAVAAGIGSQRLDQ
jgi:hypothetical protein